MTGVDDPLCPIDDHVDEMMRAVKAYAETELERTGQPPGPALIMTSAGAVWVRMMTQDESDAVDDLDMGVVQ